MTGQTFYAGTPDDYLNYLNARPGTTLLMGLLCSALGLVLLLGGGVLRILGR